MQILETARYLGSNANCFSARGIWVSLTEYRGATLSNHALHAHVNPHITLLLQGGTVEKRAGGDFERLGGQTVFFYGGEPHQNSKTLHGSKNINLEFEAEFLNENDIEESDIEKAVKNTIHAKFLLLKAYKELITRDNFSTDTITMLTLDLLTQAPTSEKRFNPPAWVHCIKEFLNDHWNRQVTLQELSVVTGIHPTTISKYFPKYFKCTLGEYMRRLKVDQSLSLIKKSHSSLAEVAYSCGFADQSHFTRTFKHFTGFLPHHFQKL